MSSARRRLPRQDLEALRAEADSYIGAGTNQIQRDIIRNEHDCPLYSSLKGTPSADDLRDWATPVATDPRKDP
jgi:hypothetical protein